MSEFGRGILAQTSAWVARQADVRILGSRIAVGGTARFDCMECDGKSTLVITRTAENAWAFNCHRAKCDNKGFVGQRQGPRMAVQVKEHARYEGDVFALSLPKREMRRAHRIGVPSTGLPFVSRI